MKRNTSKKQWIAISVIAAVLLLIVILWQTLGASLTTFLSNPEGEQRLIDPRFQSTVARAVLDGVNTYFSNQPPPGTLYAARAAAAAGNNGQGGSP